MLVICKGPTPSGLSALDVQAAIAAQVVEPEHAPTEQERQDGHFTQVVAKEREVVGQTRTRTGTIHDQLGAEAIKLESETKAPSQKVMVSPNLKNGRDRQVTLADFKRGFAFGNGVTCNAMVTLRDGSKHVMSWAVFNDADEAVVKSKAAALRSLMEG